MINSAARKGFIYLILSNLIGAIALAHLWQQYKDASRDSVDESALGTLVRSPQFISSVVLLTAWSMCRLRLLTLYRTHFVTPALAGAKIRGSGALNGFVYLALVCDIALVFWSLRGFLGQRHEFGPKNMCPTVLLESLLKSTDDGDNDSDESDDEDHPK